MGFVNIPSGVKSWKSPVTTHSALPLTGNQNGDARVVLDTSTFAEAIWICP